MINKIWTKTEIMRLMKILSFLHTVKNAPYVHWSSAQPLNLKPKPLTLLLLILGLSIFGLGESILIASGIGVSPWTVLAQGVSNYTNWSIGLSTFVLSIGVLLTWIPLKQKPGIGTILNALIIALVIEMSLPYLPQQNAYFRQILQVTAGVALVGVGSGLYLTANLGAGPRDGLMLGLQKISNRPIAQVRTTLEVSVVIIGWLMGGIVGLGTVIFALGVGPFVSLSFLLVRKFSKPSIRHRKKILTKD
jgi:hypothetical protein